MYSQALQQNDSLSDAANRFVLDLSALLEELNPAMVDRQGIKMPLLLEADNRCSMDVLIPHLTNKNAYLYIEYCETDSTLCFFHSAFHFQEHSDPFSMNAGLLALVKRFLTQQIEIETVTKASRVVRQRPFFVDENGGKTPMQCAYSNWSAFLNPFLKKQKQKERISFSISDL